MAEKSRVRKVLMQDYGLPESFFKEIDSSVKKNCRNQNAIALVFIFLGTVMSNDLVWELTDMFNNLMVIPNAIALFALTGMVVKSTHGIGVGK